MIDGKCLRDGADCNGRIWTCPKCQKQWCQTHKGQHTGCTETRVRVLTVKEKYANHRRAIGKQ